MPPKPQKRRKRHFMMQSPKTLIIKGHDDRPTPGAPPKTPTPDLVWAKTAAAAAKSHQPWWPARVIASSNGRLHVSLFGEGHVGGTSSSCPVSQAKPFFNPSIMARIMTAKRHSHSEAFLSSFHQALGFASKCLQSQLTCHCVPFDPPAGQYFDIGMCNFTAPEFVDCIRDAALGVCAVNLEDSVRLKSWVFALGQGLDCNGEVCFNRRKLLPDLVDKFDLDLDTWPNEIIEENLMNSTDDNNKGSKARKKKRASERDNGLETERCGAGGGAILKEEEEAGSAKRERKRSKYLSPPYTDIRGLPIQKQSEEKLDERDVEGVEKGNLVDFEAFSVRDIFNDFLLTCMDPIYLKWKRSAKVLRFLFEKYRDTMFVEGREYGSSANHKSGCKMNGEEVKIKADLYNGLVSSLGSSLESCLTPKMARSDLTTMCDVSRVKEELEMEIGKSKADNGAHQPKKRGRPRKEEKSLSSSGSNMPTVEKSEQKNERKDLTGSVSSVTYKTNNNVGLGTLLNFANGSYEFLEEARAQMMKTSSLENGNKLAETGKQSQEQGSSKKCNTGNSDGTSDTGPRQRGQKKKIAQAHYPNPAALLLDFSKSNTTNGTAISMSMNLPSRDQLLSTFSKFGLLVEAQSDVHPDACTARVVFARSADAEVAYNSPDKLGSFRPPYASCRLRYLPPTSDLTTPAQRAQSCQIPAQQHSARPQLSDIRKNLEIMISSLTGGSELPVKGEPSSALDGILPEVRGSLLGEMQGLLMKVEKRLGNGGASSCAPQP